MVTPVGFGLKECAEEGEAAEETGFHGQLEVVAEDELLVIGEGGLGQQLWPGVPELCEGAAVGVDKLFEVGAEGRADAAERKEGGGEVLRQEELVGEAEQQELPEGEQGHVESEAEERAAALAEGAAVDDPAVVDQPEHFVEVPAQQHGQLRRAVLLHGEEVAEDDGRLLQQLAAALVPGAALEVRRPREPLAQLPELRQPDELPLVEAMPANDLEVQRLQREVKAPAARFRELAEEPAQRWQAAFAAIDEAVQPDNVYKKLGEFVSAVFEVLAERQSPHRRADQERGQQPVVEERLRQADVVLAVGRLDDLQGLRQPFDGISHVVVLQSSKVPGELPEELQAQPEEPDAGEDGVGLTEGLGAGLLLLVLEDRRSEGLLEGLGLRLDLGLLDVPEQGEVGLTEVLVVPERGAEADVVEPVHEQRGGRDKEPAETVIILPVGALSVKRLAGVQQAGEGAALGELHKPGQQLV